MGKFGKGAAGLVSTGSEVAAINLLGTAGAGATAFGLGTGGVGFLILGTAVVTYVAEQAGAFDALAEFIVNF